jgi:anti-anti-sigma factor
METRRAARASDIPGQDMAVPEISVTVENDRALVVLRGEHEAFSADKLRAKIDALLAEGMPISVDLRHTAFLDSHVVGTLLGGKRRADDHGLGFELILGETTGWPVRRLLEVTGLNETFEIVN